MNWRKLKKHCAKETRRMRLRGRAHKLQVRALYRFLRASDRSKWEGFNAKVS